LKRRHRLHRVDCGAVSITAWSELRSTDSNDFLVLFAAHWNAIRGLRTGIEEKARWARQPRPYERSLFETCRMERTPKCSVRGEFANEKTHGVLHVTSGQDTKISYRTTIDPKKRQIQTLFAWHGKAVGHDGRKPMPSIFFSAAKRASMSSAAESRSRRT
jgi:hypothetical protein